VEDVLAKLTVIPSSGYQFYVVVRKILGVQPETKVSLGIIAILYLLILVIEMTSYVRLASMPLTIVEERHFLRNTRGNSKQNVIIGGFRLSTEFAEYQIIFRFQIVPLKP
jgi:hypothetical protein